VKIKIGSKWFLAFLIPKPVTIQRTPLFSKDKGFGQDIFR